VASVSVLPRGHRAITAAWVANAEPSERVWAQPGNLS